MTADAYVSIRNLAGELAAMRRALGPEMKLAYCFTGGGARGAYTAGVLEGFVRQSAGVEPDIIVGSSVGGIIGFAHWVDRTFGPPPGSAPIAPYATRQSVMWRAIATGNKGASKLFEPAWPVEYLSGKKAIPFLGVLTRTAEELKSASDNLMLDLKRLAEAARVVGDAAAGAPLARLLSDLGHDVTAAVSAVRAVQRPVQAIMRAAASRDARAVLRALRGLAGTAAATVRTATAATVTLERDLATLLGSSLPAIRTAATSIARDALQMLDGGGSLVGNAAATMATVTKLVALLGLLTQLLGRLILSSPVAVGVGGAALMVAAGGAVLNDHVLDPAKLQRMLVRYLATAPGVRQPASTSERFALTDWLARRTSAPDLYLVGADVTARRTLVFAVARAASLQHLTGQSNFWLVDLAAAATETHRRIFRPLGMASPLITAVLSSAASPLVFPPRRWTVQRPVQGDTLAHDVVDGGVVDNSPIDVARRAGATHIVSFELTPLLSFTIRTPVRETRARNLTTVLLDALETSMDASLLDRIDAIVLANRSASTPVPIYRIAPLDPAAAQADGRGDVEARTPSFLDFDGVYDAHEQLAMNLEDWFMQGYQDALQFEDEAQATAADPVFADYVARREAGSGATGRVRYGRRNAAWAAVTTPLPITPP